MLRNDGASNGTRQNRSHILYGNRNLWSALQWRRPYPLMTVRTGARAAHRAGGIFPVGAWTTCRPRRIVITIEPAVVAVDTAFVAESLLIDQAPSHKQGPISRSNAIAQPTGMTMPDIWTGAKATPRPGRIFPISATSADRAGWVVVTIAPMSIRAGSGAARRAARIFPIGARTASRAGRVVVTIPGQGAGTGKQGKQACSNKILCR